MADQEVKKDNQPNKPQERSVTYQTVVGRMFNALVSGGANHQGVKKILVDWFSTLSPAERIAFKADQEDVQVALKRCEAAVDIIKQETAYIVHRFEQGN